MGLLVDITKYIERRQKRMDERKKRYNMDFEVGDFAPDEPGDGGKKSSAGSTRLPYGLCKAAGIDTTGMTPSEAWAALSGETGISPKEAYKELEEKGTAKDLAKEAKEKAKEAKEEVPEEEKLVGTGDFEKEKKSDAADRFKAAIDMAADREAIEKALSGVPTGGVVRFIKIDKHGKISEHSSTAKKNADGTFTTKKGTITAELLSWWLQRDKDNGKKFGLEADDFTMPVDKPVEAPETLEPPKPVEPPKPEEKSPEGGEKAPKPAKKAKKTTSPPEMVIPAAPAITGTKIPVKTTKEIDIPNLQTVKNADSQRKAWAAKHPGYEPFVEKLQSGIKYLLENNEFCINFDAKNLASILRKGFLNQIQTATDPEIHTKTHGMYSPAKRKTASQKMFGTPKGTKAEDYEKYGYLGNPLASDAKEYASHYGQCTVILKKDRMKERTTYTYHDSLGSGYSGAAIPGKDGDSPSWEGASYEGIGTYGAYAGKPSDMMKQVMAAPDKKTSLSEIIDSWGYLELQYHGEVTMSDVDTIIFRSPADYSYVTPDVQEALDALGIKVVKLWEKKK